MSGPINHIFEDGDDYGGDDYGVNDVDDFEAIMSHEQLLSDQAEQEADWLADEVDVPEDLEGFEDGFEDEFAWADTNMYDEEY